MVGRRGFFGLAAGAVAAAPMLTRETVGNVLGGAVQGGGFANTLIGGLSRIERARVDLASMLGKTAAQIAREKAMMSVHAIDGDIEAMHSLAWHAKVRMQRDREYEREQGRHRGYLEDVIAGVFGDD